MNSTRQVLAWRLGVKLVDYSTTNPAGTDANSVLGRIAAMFDSASTRVAWKPMPHLVFALSYLFPHRGFRGPRGPRCS